jgi:hypothetical protein
MTDYLRIIPATGRTPGMAPKPSDLVEGELAFNSADGLLYAKNAAGEIVLIGPQSITNGTDGTDGTDGTSGTGGGCCGDYGMYTGTGSMPGVKGVVAECAGAELLVRWAQDNAQSCSVNTAGFIVQEKLPSSSSWTDSFHAPPDARLAVLQKPPAGTLIRVVAVDENNNQLASGAVAAAVCGSWTCKGGNVACYESLNPPDGVNFYASQELCDSVCYTIPNEPVCTWTGNLNTAGGWLSTTCTVTSGQIISCAAGTNGTVTFKPEPDHNGGNTADPDGIIGYPVSSVYNGCSIIPTWKHMALIGRIGSSGAPFLLGRLNTLTATSSGTISIRVNDQCDEDNTGDYVVVISVNNPTPVNTPAP